MILVSVLQGESPVDFMLSDQVGHYLGFHLSSPGCGMNSTALLEGTDSGAGFTRKTYRGQGNQQEKRQGRVPLHWPETPVDEQLLACSEGLPPQYTDLLQPLGFPCHHQLKEWKQLVGGETNRMLDVGLSGFGATLSAVLAAWHLEILLFTPSWRAMRKPLVPKETEFTCRPHLATASSFPDSSVWALRSLHLPALSVSAWDAL